jgi:hypothetical protein
MALSMDEQRMLAEIERRLADDDPVLAARLTSFRLPRLTFGPRSPRARLMASLLMLVVVAVVSVFVYALMPFRGQAGRDGPARTGASSSPPAASARGPGTSAPGGAAGSPGQAPTQTMRPATGRSGELPELGN